MHLLKFRNLPTQNAAAPDSQKLSLPPSLSNVAFSSLSTTTPDIRVSWPAMGDTFPELPEECWDLILGSLSGQYHHHEGPSLVCKRFLDLTNRLRRSLSLRRPFPSLLSRFPNLIRIDLSGGFHGDLDPMLRCISSSGLRIQTLDISGHGPLPLRRIQELGRCITTIKALICARVKGFRDTDLAAIAESFQNLEDLDVSYPVEEMTGDHWMDSAWSPRVITDTGVEFVCRKLVRLRSLDISGNCCLSDRSLLSVAENCVLLQRIAILDCDFLSAEGVKAVISRCGSLVSISLNGHRIALSSPSILAHGRKIQTLDLSDMVVSDELLTGISYLQGSLRKLTLSNCQKISFPIVSVVLQRCSLLEYLDLEGADFLTDDSVKELLLPLMNLRFINLSSCRLLTNEAFRTILNTARELEEIRMEETNLGVGLGFSKCGFMMRNLRILRLRGNKYLRNELLAEIGEICSGVVELSVRGCAGISKVDRFQELEILDAGRSGFSDMGLNDLARSCRKLVTLNVERCVGISETGVKEAVRGCKMMREVNLAGCGLSSGLVGWMVFTRPSLKKVVPPQESLLSELGRESCLQRHGCSLCSAREWHERYPSHHHRRFLV